VAAPFRPLRTPTLERGAFVLLLAVLSLSFFVLLLPFFGAVLWAVALALLFTPMYRRIAHTFGGRKTLAALATVLVCVVLVVLPLTVIGILLVQDVLELSARINSGELGYAATYQRLLQASPQWLDTLLHRVGLGDPAAIQQRVQEAAQRWSQAMATGALSVGQNLLSFVLRYGVMLYLLFFLLRDGDTLSTTVRQALPLARPLAHRFVNRVTLVTRATVKGNVIVAALQGALGGIAFAVLGIGGALLWGVLMGLLSLVPAVGGAIVWVPAALYLLATGAVWKSVALVAFCALVVGSVDNVLRPILVGKETRMPDYIVLLSTIGGISLIGINGFVVGPVIAALFMTAWGIFAESGARRGMEE
jgi:predicted PurR-regulated permease PerM